MSTPTRGYSWPSAKPGNWLASKHRAYSPRAVDPLAEELVTSAAATVDWWRACDMPAVWAWARTEARIQLLSEWLADGGGEMDESDEVRPAAHLLTRLESRAESLRSKLGLDPLSRARLGRDVAAGRLDLALLWGADENATYCGDYSDEED